jgi:hypothetical protein
MNATCQWCEIEMLPGRACEGGTATVEGVAYARIPYTLPPDLAEQAPELRELWATWPAGWAPACHDCGVRQGALHHPGCDMEQCPRCMAQAISCGCRWEGDAADPGFDPKLLRPESPHARRAA